VIIRDHAARHTLAGGRVVDIAAPRRGRSRPERLAALAALAVPDAGDALERLVAAAGIVELAPFALARNLPLGEIEALADLAGLRRLGGVAVSADRLVALGDAIATKLAEWHRAQPDALGPSRAALFARLRGQAPEPVLDAALAALIAEGRTVRDGAALRLTEHQPRLSREDERLWQRVEPLLAGGELRPPRVRELAAALGLEPEPLARFLKRVERFGRVAPVAPNRFFLPRAVGRLADIAAELAAESPDGSFTAAAFKDRTGIGRNLTIAVLEYLDQIGATKRVGDARTALRRGADLFG
jgi:selenocysteine-specific elongation factor